MISWIVASHDPTIHEANLRASLGPPDEDQLITIWNAPSIAKAYNDGQDMATHPIRCYIHHDVQILDLVRLRSELIDACSSSAVGMIGVVGSRDARAPWWEGACCGSVVDGRIGLLNHGRGGQCSTLDGLLLATTHRVEWDEAIPGWHGYDYDACRQMLDRRLVNWCLTGGHELLRHNTTGSTVKDEIDGWGEAMTLLRAKWGIHG